MRAWTAIAAALGLAFTSCAAHAERTPPPGMQDSRVRVVSYNPDEVYRINVHGTAGTPTFLTVDSTSARLPGDERLGRRDVGRDGVQRLLRRVDR